MSDQQSPNNDLLILSPDAGAWGLNIVTAQYQKICGSYNEIMLQIMTQLNSVVALSAQASFEIAGIAFSSAICEFGTDMLGAASALHCSWKAGNTQKMNKLKQSDILKNKKGLTDDIKKLDSNNPDDLRLKTEKQKEIDRLTTRENKLSDESSSVQQKATQDMAALQMLSKGVLDIPKGVFENRKNRNDANQKIAEAIQRQSAGTYDTVKGTIRAFLDPHYLAGLAILASLQIK